MTGVRAEIDALLVLERGRTFELVPHADGFELRGAVEGEGGWFRHWSLEPAVGLIDATDANVVERVWVNGCAPGAVAWPAVSAELESEIELTMPWPAECAGTIEEGETTRYEVRCSDAEPARWVGLPGARACVGVGADGALVRIVAEAPPVRRSREPVIVRAGDWAAVLQQDRHLHVERRSWLDEDRGESLESAHGTAWLGRLADGSLCSITADDAQEGAPIELPDSPHADELTLWQRWPVAVRTTWWRDGERTRAEIRFGDDLPEQWARIGDGDVWAGSSAAGELRALLFGDVETSSSAFEGRPGLAGDLGEGRWEDAMVETARWIRFELYGLAGAVGVPSGFGSTYGVPSSLAITFGDSDGDGPSIIVASSRSDRRTAVWEALDRLALDGEREERDDVPWTPAEILVDGTPLPFEVFRSGERWAAVGLVGRTTIWIAADGYDLDGVSLTRVHDLNPHVEQRRREFSAWAAHVPPPEPPGVRARQREAAEVVDGLMEAFDGMAGAPPIGPAFTDRVVAGWGGCDRYARLLGLHTMLRQICGHGGGGRPVVRDDGSVTICSSLHHAVPSDGSGTVSVAFAVYRGENAESPPPPDPAAARRGERHEIELRLVQEDGAWRIDTDLLQILIDRLGTFEEVVRPLSEQTS